MLCQMSLTYNSEFIKIQSKQNKNSIKHVKIHKIKPNPQKRGCEKVNQKMAYGIQYDSMVLCDGKYFEVMVP